MSFSDGYDTLPAYILGITERIWEGRGLGLIRRWYAPDCIMHTAFGTFAGVESVVSGTAATLHEFPDRQLLGEDIIYSEAGPASGYSSHRIVSTMHHRGDGGFGAATGRAVWARTVADCLIRDGVIVEEWLVRDQAAIALQVGLDPRDWGRQRAETMAVADTALPDPDELPVLDAPADDPFGVAATLRRIFNETDLSAIPDGFDRAVNLHLPRGATAYGHGGADAWAVGLLAAFPDARLFIENIITRTDPGQAARVAVRFRIAGTHDGAGAYGPPSGARMHIPGILHAEVVAGRICRAFVLIDELAIWTGISLRLG